MNKNPAKGSVYSGMSLAVLAAVIWSGNFIVARGVSSHIPPVSLAFFRWLTASVILFPFCIRGFLKQRSIVYANLKYFFWIALMGITLFNTCIYVAGHYSQAINLALIGTTSSPVFSLILAAIFLRERITANRLIGLLICIAGILYLLSGGNVHHLITLRFSKGDWWVLAGGMCFAIYNILVRIKPPAISPFNFLLVNFSFGTILLFPLFLIERSVTPPIQWTTDLGLIIAYLGLGASVISYLCWNAAINRLGAARTAIFGNLIPVCSVLEAVLLLHEKITVIHIISGSIVILGLTFANLPSYKKKTNTAFVQE